MKKTLIIVAVVTFIFTSCKKDYTCSCDTTVTTKGVAVVSTTTFTFNDTESNATKSCDEMDTGSNVVSSFVFSQTLCSIK